jgi:hypothetical protein
MERLTGKEHTSQSPDAETEGPTTPEDVIVEIAGLLGMEREQGKWHLKRRRAASKRRVIGRERLLCREHPFHTSVLTLTPSPGHTQAQDPATPLAML